MLVVLMVSMMSTVALLHDRVPCATGYEPADGIRHGQPLLVPTAALLLPRPGLSSQGVFLFSPCLQAFLKWRDPDSNRGHHDFQTYEEAFRYAENPHR